MRLRTLLVLLRLHGLNTASAVAMSNTSRPPPIWATSSILASRRSALANVVSDAKTAMGLICSIFSSNNGGKGGEQEFRDHPRVPNKSHPVPSDWKSRLAAKQRLMGG